MARKKKRGPGRPKGSKTKAKRRGRPPKAAARKRRAPARAKLAAGGKRRGRPPGSKTRTIGASAESLYLSLSGLAVSFNRIAMSLEALTRSAPAASDYGQLKGPDPLGKHRAEVLQSASRVGAQAATIPADQGVQAQV